MIRLEKISYDNFREVIKLKVADEQQSFVAPNDISLMEAYLSLDAGGKVFPFAIADDEVPVGFVMMSYGTDKSWDDPPAIAENNYCIWRFMIDEQYQNRGYGKKALQLALDFVRSFPCGKADICWLSYEPENIRAKELYRSFGFEETGDTDGDEVIAALKL